MTLLKDLLADLEANLQAENAERGTLGAPPVGKGEAILLGQFSLIVNEKIAARIPRAMTNDIDVWLKGNIGFIAAFKKSVAKHGYRFDDLSREIWLPKEVTFETIYESHLAEI